MDDQTTSSAQARQQDDAARQVIRTALDENIMVLAGAGAGKTHEMITRMVQLVRQGTPVEKIAAITFTKKAAGEMQGRFFARLQQAAEDALPREQAALQRARQKIDRCYIGTIHSFCGRLLRERSLEAGLPPDFSEIDDREERELRREAWQRYLRTQEPEQLEKLRRLGVEPADLEDFFGDLCQFEDLELHTPKASKPDLAPALEAVAELMKQAEPMVSDRPVSDKGYDDTQKALQKARRFLDYHGLQTDGDRVQLLKFFADLTQKKNNAWKTKGRSLTYNRWGDKKSDAYAFAQYLKKEGLPELMETSLAQVLEEWEAYVYNKTARFTLPAVAAYRRRRLEEGHLTFHDLLSRARDLLRDHPEVRAFFQKRYRYLFVDEFQDTDPIQAELLFYLTDDQHLEEKKWAQLQPRPGSLFLVGDGKQSIYRFRRADYETFNLVQERLKASESGRILNLQRCFRTFENLCGQVNKTFPTVFKHHEKPYQAPFQELLHVENKGDGHRDSRVRRITVPYQKRNYARKIAQVDARQIAEFIAAMTRASNDPVRQQYIKRGVLSEEVGYGDFMILARNSTRLHIYAEALEALDVPYDLAGGGNMGASEELKALLDILETVYNPDDPISLLSYLRGPFAGLSDRDLYQFEQAGGRFHFWSAVPEALEAESAARFTEAFKRLRQADKWLKSLPPSAALERLMGALGILAFSAVQPGGSSRAGTLLKMLALVKEMEAQNNHWLDIMEELRELVEDDSYKVEEMTLEAGARNAADEPTAVQIMNLHKAKGLEAKVVFLADPYSSRSGGHEPRFHVSRVGGEEPFVALPVTQKSKHHSGRRMLYKPQGWEAFKAKEKRFLAAENNRLLYVAATRAENLLVVSRYEHKKRGILDGFWGALNPCLEEVPELEQVAPLQEKPVELSVDFDAVNQRRKEIRLKAQQPSFKLTTVTAQTEDKKGSGAEVRGHGQNYGTLVHHLLELIVSQRLLRKQVPTYLSKVSEEYGVALARKAEVLQALDSFLASPLWTTIQDAHAAGRPVYTEVPFAAGENKTITSGQIDLVLYQANGWHIIDWKTVEGSPEKLKQRYGSQLSAYKAYWKSITGEPVARVALWLTEQAQILALDKGVQQKIKNPGR